MSPKKKSADRPEFETVFLSDIHLGSRNSKASEVITFLKTLRCKTLVLNGDIVDAWALNGSGKWLPEHTRFVRTVLKKMEKQGTHVIYLRGNHDDILERFLPVSFGNLVIEEEYVHKTPKGDYLVVHGDGFDAVTTNHKWVAVAGAVGYDALLKINRIYNKWRTFRGKPHYSLSKTVKARVKSAVSFVGRYEDQLKELARIRHCRGIICGHIHTPADKLLDEEIHYINSGDWVESLTAIVEHSPGDFEVIEYESYMESLGLSPEISNHELEEEMEEAQSTSGVDSPSPIPEHLGELVRA
ncbi:MAG: UDP-2,3-diacylglucosamine diphosphatase [Verrucomicrobiota bacterium]